VTKTHKTQKPAKPRQSNPERSAATREKLLRATVDCLYSVGYAQTSTVLVTKRAGVSRGAMLHHFPSKGDLMIATIQYIREHMRTAHRAKLDPIDDPVDRFAALAETLWAEFSKPIGVARIEIMLASRSDPEYGGYFRQLNEELDRRHKDAVWARAERLGFTDRKQVDYVVQLYAAAIRGLAIDNLHPAMRADVEGAVRLLRDTMRGWAVAPTRQA
jgi:AcrR family transcriptional regulator